MTGRKLFDLVNAVAIAELTEEGEPLVEVLWEDNGPPTVFCGAHQLQGLANAVRTAIEDSKLNAAKLVENS